MSYTSIWLTILALFFLPTNEPALSSELKKTKINLLPDNGKESQITVGEAFDSKIVNSSLVATHLARAQNFLISMRLS